MLTSGRSKELRPWRWSSPREEAVFKPLQEDAGSGFLALAYPSSCISLLTLLATPVFSAPLFYTIIPWIPSHRTPAVPTAAPSQKKHKSRKRHNLSTTTGSGGGSRIFYHLHKFLKWLLHQFSTLVHSVKPELPKISTNTHTFPVNFPGSLLLVYAILQLPSGALKSTCDETLTSELISCDSEWANLPPLC